MDIFSSSQSVEKWLKCPTVLRALAIEAIMLFSENSESLIINWSVWMIQG